MTCVLLCALLVCPRAARANAQDDPVAQLRMQAMDAYHALDIERALALLDEALSLARARRLPVGTRSQLQLSLGVVHAAGLGDAMTGRAHMHRAVCGDASVELDMLLATPALDDLLVAARQDARSLGCNFDAVRVKQAHDDELPPVLKPKVVPPPNPPISPPPIAPRTEPGRGMFVQLGPTVGVGLIDSGMAADRPPPGVAPGEPGACCLQVRSGGLTPHGAMRGSVGVFVSETVALSALVRVQLRAGEGDWAGLLLGGRVEHLAWSGGRRRPSVSWFTGMSAGRIDVQPASGESTAYATSGPAGAHLGSSLRVPMGAGSAFVLSPELDVQFPDVLFNVDVTTAVELTLD